jgi:hypothetical protein
MTDPDHVEGETPSQRLARHEREDEETEHRWAVLQDELRALPPGGRPLGE